MKKIFTLIAVAMMTGGAMAQGTYGVQNGDAGVASGTKNTSVNNITMTWGVEGGADFKGGNKKNEALKELLGATAYCEGNGANGAFDSGTVYYFEPKNNGALQVGFVLNSGKAFFVQDGEGNNVNFTMTDAAGNAVELTNGGSLTDKLTGGVVKFNVVGGKKYAVYCTGSKLGFYGFKYEVSGTGIADINADVNNADAPAYNLAGQRVNANAKGLVIKNGKKYVNK